MSALDWIAVVVLVVVTLEIVVLICNRRLAINPKTGEQKNAVSEIRELEATCLWNEGLAEFAVGDWVRRTDLHRTRDVLPVLRQENRTSSGGVT